MAIDDRLRSLKGHEVVLTGRFRLGTQPEVQQRARSRGAVINDRRVNGSTSILVIATPSGHWKYDDRGVKIEEALSRRKRGQRIYFISEGEFLQLLRGQGLSHQQTTAALAWAEPVHAGLPYREASTSGHRSGSLAVDLDQLDRATVAHQRVCNRLARAAEAAGYQPLSPFTDGPAYDVAWMQGEQIWLAEVKSISAASERQQIRLGIGQVLDYSTAMRSRGFDVQPMVALTGRPSSEHWLTVCQAVGVILCWPASWQSVFAR